MSEHYIHTEFSPGVHSPSLDTDGESQYSVQLTNCHFVVGYEMVQNTLDTCMGLGRPVGLPVHLWSQTDLGYSRCHYILVCRQLSQTLVIVLHTQEN